MPKSKKSKKTDEKPSTDSILTVNTIIEETRGTRTEFTCYAENYSLLEQGIEYEICDATYSQCWELCFCKCHGFLSVCLTTDTFMKDVDFCLRRSDGQIMNSISTEELEEGMHIAQFEESEISNPENLLLMNGTLIAHCTYTARPLEYNIVLTRGLQETSAESIHNSHVDGLCNDLKHLYLNSSFSNFIIVARGIAFKVHSLIISLRCHYFDELFRNAPYLVSHYIEIDASPGIVHEVLLYIYSGELRDMEFTYMIEIFYIACNWKITRLVQICIDYFKANFAANNILQILYRAYQCNLPELEHEVLRFIRNLPQCVMETQEWAEIIRKVRRVSGSSNL